MHTASQHHITGVAVPAATIATAAEAAASSTLHTADTSAQRNSIGEHNKAMSLFEYQTNAHTIYFLFVIIAIVIVLIHILPTAREEKINKQQNRLECTFVQRFFINR